MRPRTESIDTILAFWFGKGQTATEVAAEKNSLWWSKDADIDQQITDRFAATCEAVANGELADWAESPHGLLALIICTDQFPRNMYRDTERAFTFDSIALTFAKTCVDSGAAQQLTTIERTFAYLPFEHSEDIAEQKHSAALYKALADNATGDDAELLTNNLNYAVKHLEIIQRFGRFPHRNQILGRLSTEQEQIFLAQPGSSF